MRIWSFLAFLTAFAEPLHFSADRQHWDRQERIIQLYGRATIRKPGETLLADHIRVDLKKRFLEADGNCVLTMPEVIVRADGLRMYMDTKEGTILRGRVSNDRFTLRGEKIEKFSSTHYRASGGEYTTCHDCQNSWSLFAADADFEFEGYGYLHDITAKIKGVPSIWLPYLILPLKTKRQTGFLLPKPGRTGTNGSMMTVPFFWAIDRSVDATFAPSYYSKRGPRLELQSRYMLANDNQGEVNSAVMSDKSMGAMRAYVQIHERFRLGQNVLLRARVNEVTDNLYPFHFGKDMVFFSPSVTEAFTSSTLLGTYESDFWQLDFMTIRIRNLLYKDPVLFDPRTVQLLPGVLLSTRDRVGFGVYGVKFSLANMTRPAGVFDAQQRLGIDPLRRTVRAIVEPGWYYPVRVDDAWMLTPSVSLLNSVYQFSGIPSLVRSAPKFSLDVETQLERIYERDDPSLPRVKHLIRPMVRYSYIPKVYEDTRHPFLQQMQYAEKNNTSGYFFDDNDIIPYSTSQTGANYFVPQGNALQYGFVTEFIQKRISDRPEYRKVVALSLAQAVNFIELFSPINPMNPRPLTRLIAASLVQLDHVQSSTTYQYYTDILPASSTDNRHPSKHAITTHLKYIHQGATHRLIAFERSIGFDYTFNQVTANTSNLSMQIIFSINDYIMPRFSIGYMFNANEIGSANLSLLIQSPGLCWRLTPQTGYSPTNGMSMSIDFALNFIGEGFGGVGDMVGNALR